MTSALARSTGAIFALLLLSGCAGGAGAPPANLEEGLTGETPNHVVVTVSKITRDVRFPNGADEPDALTMSELNDFLLEAGADRGAVVLIERNATPEDDIRTAILSGALARKGLRIIVRVGVVTPGDLRLTMDHYVASAPGCPNWSKLPGNDAANTLPSDFGCATAANLAAMVADPRDLIAGSDLGPESGDPAVAPLQRYRAGKVAPLNNSGATGAPPPGANPTADPSP